MIHGILYRYSDKKGVKMSPMMPRADDSRWPDVIVADHLLHANGIQKIYNEVGRFDAGYSDLDQFTLERRWVSFLYSWRK